MKHRQQSSPDEERGNSVQTMAKLKRYDGATTVESLLSQFQACARYYNWNDEDKWLRLRCLVDGDATNLLWEEAHAGETST